MKQNLNRVLLTSILALVSLSLPVHGSQGKEVKVSDLPTPTITLRGGVNQLDLSDKNLTSLVGIDTLKVAKKKGDLETEAITDIPNLILLLNKNKITALPTELKELKNVRWLEVSNNPINYISPALIDFFKSLTTFEIENNKTLNLPSTDLNLKGIIKFLGAENDLLEALKTSEIIDIQAVFKKYPKLINMPITDKGLTPLMYAAKRKKVKTEVLDTLLKLGADIKQEDALQNSALHYAASAINRPAYDFLVSKGAKTNKRNKAGKTPQELLQEAVTSNAPFKKELEDAVTTNDLADTTEALTKYPELINAQLDENQNTALLLAVKNSTPDLQIIQLLITKKANVNAVNKDGDSALLLAVKNATPDINLVKLLLAHKANIEAVDTKTKETPLLIAVKHANPDIQLIELLLANKANVNAVDKQQNTALHIASKRLDFPLIALLIANKAKTGLKNKENKLAKELLNEANEALKAAGEATTQSDKDFQEALTAITK